MLLLGAGPGASRGYGRRGRQTRVVNEISRGEKVITPDIALPRAMAIYGDPGFWGNLEADYRLALARLANRCRAIYPACPAYPVGWRSWPE